MTKTTRGFMEALLDPNISLRILIVDADQQGITRIGGAMSRLRTKIRQGLDDASVITIREAYHAMETYEPNVVFVDLISTGLRDSITFVQHVRTKYPTVVFALYCNEKELEANASEVYFGWGVRLRHYFLLSKNVPDDEFDHALLFNLSRAQFDLYAYGARESLSRVRAEGGHAPLTELQISKLQTQLTQLGWQLRSLADNDEARSVEARSRQCRAFVIMALTDDLSDVYEIGIKEFLLGSGFQEIYRVDEHYPRGLIIQSIYEEIHSSTVVIAELSTPRPNCYYELGFADALGKPIVRIVRTGTTLPFDVNQYPFIFYNSVADLRPKLKNALSELGVLTQQ